MAKDPSRRTSTSTVELPEWLTSASQNAIGKAQDFYSQGHQPYGGQRVSGTSADTLTAQNNLRNLYVPTGNNPLFSEAAAGFREGGSPIQTERVVDESGRLGAISDYMNPHIGAMLDPALRHMQEQTDRERNRIGGVREHSGAYGDARHGMLESKLFERSNQAQGDVISSAYGNAFQSAMGQRQTDIARMFGVDANNQNAAFSGASGMLQTASAEQASLGQEFQQQQQQIQSMMASGALTQQQAQNELDVAYEAYLKQQQDSYDRLAALVGATGGVPYGRTQTDVGAQGYPGAQIIGSLLGSWLGG